MSVTKSSSYDHGKSFEDLFRICSLRCNIAISRMPDGCRQLGRKIVRVKTPFDWIISYQKQIALIDTKTIQGERFPYSAITEHQVTEMKNHSLQGSICGYVVWTRKNDQIFFVEAITLFQSLSMRGSFSAQENRVLGNSHYFDIRLLFGAV